MGAAQFQFSEHLPKNCSEQLGQCYESDHFAPPVEGGVFITDDYIHYEHEPRLATVRSYDPNEERWVETHPATVRSYDSSMDVNEVLSPPPREPAMEPAMPAFDAPTLNVVMLPVLDDEGSPDKTVDTSLPMLMPAARKETYVHSDERCLSPVYEEDTSLPTLLPLAVEEAATKRVTIQFVHQGNVQLVNLTKRPMGVMFQNEAPFIVVSTTPGSEAEQQGVQPGWAFSMVDGVRVANMNCKDLVELIGERTQVLPKDPATTHPELEMEFAVNGLSKVLVFSKTPLGLTFNQTSARPFVVEGVVPRSEGAKAGIEPGWELKRVGDFPISTDWADGMKALHDGIALLPRY